MANKALHNLAPVYSFHGLLLSSTLYPTEENSKPPF